MVWSGDPRQGEALSGEVRLGMVGSGSVRKGRDRFGGLRYGLATADRGFSRVLLPLGKPVQGLVRHGGARLGMARNGVELATAYRVFNEGSVRCGLVGFGEARSGSARRGKARLG